MKFYIYFDQKFTLQHKEFLRSKTQQLSFLSSFVCKHCCLGVYNFLFLAFNISRRDRIVKTENTCTCQVKLEVNKWKVISRDALSFCKMFQCYVSAET